MGIRVGRRPIDKHKKCRHVCIPDLHGKDIWQELDFNQWEKFVFLGDYVDSYTHTRKQVVENLMNIIEFKRAHPDRVVLLLGNHDVQYFFPDAERCSGFTNNSEKVLRPIFFGNSELFQFFYSYEQTLVTHAGVSIGWMRESGVPEDAKLDEFLTSKFSPVFWCGKKRGGYNEFGGPVWADKEEMEKSLPDGWHQIVGHTKVKDHEIVTVWHRVNEMQWTDDPDIAPTITFTDTLDTQPLFLEF